MTTSDQIKLFCIGLSVVLKHRPASPDEPATAFPLPSLETVQDPGRTEPVETQPPAVSRQVR